MTDRAWVSGTRPRAAARHKLFEPVLLRQEGVSLRAHMLDLSVSGALLHADRPPAIGAHVIVAGELLTVSGRVVWMRGKRFGIHFEYRSPSRSSKGRCGRDNPVERNRRRPVMAEYGL